MAPIRTIEKPDLPKRYRSARKLADGSLEVDYISDHPGIRADGTYHFRPRSREYAQIMKVVGDLAVGDEVIFDHGRTPEEEALWNSIDPLDG